LKFVNGLYKSAVGRLLAGMGAMAAGELGTMGALSGLHNLVKSEGEDMSHTSPQRITALLAAVKKKHGLDVGYRHDPVAISSNAGYMTSDMWSRSAEGIEKRINDPRSHDPQSAEYVHPSTRRMLIKKVDDIGKSMRRGGLVMTGKHFKKPGTVEHELGHAIAGSRGNAVERATIQHDIPKYSPLYHTLPTYLAAFKGGGKGPMVGALAGGLTGLLTDIPTLYAEYSANKYGDKLMSKDQPQQGRNKSYGSYLASSVLPGAITGGLYGLAKRKFKL